MKFEAEDPAEVTKADQGGINRNSGAARAISVCVPSSCAHLGSSISYKSPLVVHRPRSEVGRLEVV
jgi:hypothetical protein